MHYQMSPIRRMDVLKRLNRRATSLWNAGGSREYLTEIMGRVNDVLAEAAHDLGGIFTDSRDVRVRKRGARR